MTLDIRGSLKNTRISKNPLIVIDELLANSIDAFLIRQSGAEGASQLLVNLKVNATKVNLLGDVFDVEIVCEDNGCGLGPQVVSRHNSKEVFKRKAKSILLSFGEKYHQNKQCASTAGPAILRGPRAARVYVGVWAVL